jgi:competence protein ComEA
MAGDMTDLRYEIKKLGYKIKYVPHEVMKDHNACYNVIYKGMIIKPPVANKLGIPINEIWISEKWRKYEEYILYHELAEIKYRFSGYNVEEAHILAEYECIKKWKYDAVWREMVVELHISDIINMVIDIKKK